MTIRLKGDGINAHWNIPRSLEMLQGLQNSAMLLIRELDDHVEHRDSGGGKHPNMMGNAVAVIVLTSYAAEIAFKTLHAQTKPNKPPPRGHFLLGLYDKLDPETKLEAQELIRKLKPLGSPRWLGETPDIRSLIKQGNTNFSDWRYLPEKPKMTGGVPKVLVNIVQVIQHLCLHRVLGPLQNTNDGPDDPKPHRRRLPTPVAIPSLELLHETELRRLDARRRGGK